MPHVLRLLNLTRYQDDTLRAQKKGITFEPKDYYMQKKSRQKPDCT